MIVTRRSMLHGATAAVAVGITLSALSPAALAWEPRKPVELVIMAGQGGGADKLARFIQSLIEKHNLSPKPLVPVNKPGGSGAEALVYLNQHKGDDHVIMATLNSLYTTPLRQANLGVDITKFDPIARLAEDTFLLWVHKDSGITDVDGFVKAAKAKGNDWIMAGTGKAQEDELLTAFLNKTYGLNMKYVPFKGGGDVAKALAGKNADSTVNNPSEALGFYEAGTVLPLAAFTADRLPLFPNTPTFGELGHDMSYFMQRSIIGPEGMSAEASQFYTALFEKVYATEEWKKYMKDKALQGDFLSGAPLMEYFRKGLASHKTMLTEIGEL